MKQKEETRKNRGCNCYGYRCYLTLNIKNLTLGMMVMAIFRHNQMGPKAQIQKQ